MAIAIAALVGASGVVPALATAAPAQTAHSTPTYAVVPVANWPCPATQTYACTTGGYAGQNTWGYGSAASHDSAGRAHNCTLYAAFKLAAAGVPPPTWSGDASTWATKADAAGTPVDQSPAVGAIAQWNANHVAYVESVDPGGVGITISEDNYEVGAPYPGGYTGTVHIASSSAAWPDNFIHFPGSGSGGTGGQLGSSRLAFTRSDGTFVRSGDGAPWQQIMTSPASDIAVGGARVALVNSEGGFYRVNDSSPWIKISAGITHVAINDDGRLAFTRSDGTFVRSGDGAPWQQIMTSPASDIAVSATRVALVNSEGGFFRADDGAPWTKVSAGIVGLAVGGA